MKNSKVDGTQRAICLIFLYLNKAAEHNPVPEGRNICSSNNWKYWTVPLGTEYDIMYLKALISLSGNHLLPKLPLCNNQ